MESVSAKDPSTIGGIATVSLLHSFIPTRWLPFSISGHSHSHNQPMGKMVFAGLVLVPALSPCATTLPVFLVVGNSSTVMVLLFRYRMKNDSEF
ncbi:hypothetical protein Godav_027267 [Gossypium davidsonii]|uniref:Uncharacterized protein n=1 Tax=Gossypium davidsonii TaxID=34287 RepID=A0A7J8RX28_GOSDV|nr:hypothetical protein [Gossypium davidsonii]